MTSVLVCDDSPLAREALRRAVATVPGVDRVTTATNGEEVLRRWVADRSDLVLMDVRMPDLDGIEATRLICGTPDTAQVRVVILTTYDLDEYVYAALRAGASGFLLKDTAPADLLTALHVVAAGDALLAPTVTRRLITEFTRRPEPALVPSAQLAGITDRERQVLTLVGRGLNNHEITHHLQISLATTRTHISHLLTKLDARDRAQLVIVAYETGLLRPHT
jgi:DNA-binding NarL/FixJ family response regulator